MGICRLAQGVINFTINGRAYEVTEDNITIQPDPFTREALANGRYSVKKTSAAVHFTMHVPVGTRVKDLLGLCDGVVVVQEQNGRTWIFNSASLTHGDAPYDVQTGKFVAVIIAPDCQELISQGTQTGTTLAA